MKAIMYHYVMPSPEDFPFFRYLHIDDFRRQLDHFATTEGFVDRDSFLHALEIKKTLPHGIILTFDDGLACHYDYVLPELKQRGLWGLFFIPTGPFHNKKLLDVHRVHLLLGQFSGLTMMKAALNLVEDRMLVHKNNKIFAKEAYRHQDNESSVYEFKRLFNYYITKQHRTGILDKLMKQFFGDEKSITEKYYMNIHHLRELHKSSMILGGHSVSHTIMSTLLPDEQEKEIQNCLNFLHQITKEQPVSCFCYPYRGFHSFNAETERLLFQNGCQFSFNVEQRDITCNDLLSRPMALPCYNCNQFKYGQAHMG